MKILLVRHAQSEGNVTHDYSVATCDLLSELGKSQAQQLADDLTECSFDHILVSPLQRAMETLAPYLIATGQKAEIWPELAEMGWQEERIEPATEWRKKPAEIPLHLKEFYTFRDNMALRPFEPQTFSEGLCRVNCVIEMLIEKFGATDKTILILSHGHFIREFLNVAKGGGLFVRFPHENCGQSLLEFTDSIWSMNYLNRLGKCRI